MSANYTSLVLSYRVWHSRMTTERLDRRGPATGFAAMQGLNVLSLLLLMPLSIMPGWFFVAIPFVGGSCAFWLVSRIYRAHPITAPYAAKLTDAVPRVREFPIVYAYLLCTLLLFVGCIYVAVHRAA